MERTVVLSAWEKRRQRLVELEKKSGLPIDYRFAREVFDAEKSIERADDLLKMGRKVIARKTRR